MVRYIVQTAGSRDRVFPTVQQARAAAWQDTTEASAYVYRVDAAGQWELVCEYV